MDAKDPIEQILIIEPTEPNDKNDPIEKPAIKLAMHARANTLFKLVTEAIENIDE